jgi:hypothetical protein
MTFVPEKLTGVIMKKHPGKTNQKDRSLPWRNFIGTISAVSAVFTIMPRHVQGGIRYTAPCDLLNVAGIRVGVRGMSEINAICPMEVDERQHLKIDYDDSKADANNNRP